MIATLQGADLPNQIARSVSALSHRARKVTLAFAA
jgi:hypothetical protein